MYCIRRPPGVRIERALSALLVELRKGFGCGIAENHLDLEHAGFRRSMQDTQRPLQSFDTKIGRRALNAGPIKTIEEGGYIENLRAVFNEVFINQLPAI